MSDKRISVVVSLDLKPIIRYPKKPISEQQYLEYHKTLIHAGPRPRSKLAREGDPWPVSMLDRLRHLTKWIRTW